ncbi:MAG: 3-dehydroquinate synthase [Pyrinomonadaceae bacterium]
MVQSPPNNFVKIIGYDIKIGHDIFKNCGEWARRNVSKDTKKIALVSNRKVFQLYGETVEKNLKKAGFEVCVWLMKDGETHKNFRSLETALKFFSRNQLKRTDAVVALGGGVVGDLAGFAAAIYLRGIDFLQIPTTLLAMIDSSVGGKTAVNTEFGKNLVGAFHQPKGVLIDVETLITLARRELTAGFCEAVKQAAIADRKLFDQTNRFLKKYSPNNFKKYFADKEFIRELESLISNQISFKAEIVAQDAMENIGRTDAKSRKILNFGHTLAHALEKATDYKYFKHGEAVGYGIIFAAELSKKLDIFGANELNLLNDVVASVGTLPKLDNIKPEVLIENFAFDKKAIGDSLHWVLLEAIGKPKIIENKNIPQSAIKSTLNKMLKTHL